MVASRLLVRPADGCPASSETQQGGLRLLHLSRCRHARVRGERLAPPASPGSRSASMVRPARPCARRCSGRVARISRPLSPHAHGAAMSFSTPARTRRLSSSGAGGQGQRREGGGCHPRAEAAGGVAWRGLRPSQPTGEGAARRSRELCHKSLIRFQRSQPEVAAPAQGRCRRWIDGRGVLGFRGTPFQPHRDT